jgi:NifU-like protein
MGAEALQAAVVDWARRRGVPYDELGLDAEQLAEDEGRVVCRCFNLTEPYVRRKVTEMGLKTIPEVTAAIKAGGACTACHHEPGGLQDILDEVWGKQAEVAPPQPESQKAAQRTPYQLAKDIERVIDQQVRPRLQADGGDLEIVDIRDKKVYARLLGVCASCIGSRHTLRLVVEDALQREVDAEVRVIEV